LYILARFCHCIALVWLVVQEVRATVFLAAQSGVRRLCRCAGHEPNPMVLVEAYRSWHAAYQDIGSELTCNPLQDGHTKVTVAPSGKFCTDKFDQETWLHSLRAIVHERARRYILFLARDNNCQGSNKAADGVRFQNHSSDKARCISFTSKTYPCGVQVGDATQPYRILNGGATPKHCVGPKGTQRSGLTGHFIEDILTGLVQSNSPCTAGWAS